MLKNNKLKLLFKIVFGFVWTLFACELFLRVFHPVPVVPRYVTAGTFGIRVNEPNRRYWHSSADFKIEIRTNAQGMRADHDIPYEKPAGTKRIVVLGDSFSMGYEVSLEDSFLVQMENRLKAAGQKVEVVNLSVSGHGTAEELLMLQNEGIKYHPDLVLVCYNSTDPEDNVRCGLYSLTDGTLKRANAEFLPGVSIQQRLYHIPGYEWIAANSNLYSFAREQFSWNIAKKLMVAIAAIRQSAATPAAALPSANAASEPYAETITVTLLQELKKTSESAGAKYLILDIPIRNAEHDFISTLPPRAIKPETDMPTLDVIGDFKAHMDKPLYTSRSQGHFTPHGCDIVGDALARHILAKQLISGPQ